MRAYKDPTADAAIANVQRERQPKKRKHNGVARYYEQKEGKGKHVRINRAEWFYSKMRRCIEEVNMKLKIEYLSPGELTPYENNAKLHPAEQIEQIKKSINEFGYADPIAIDKNNVVVEGHGRLIAARELGLEMIPVIRLGELTEEQRKAYTLVHNKLTMNSNFDFDILMDELESIAEIDMADFGFLDTSSFDWGKVPDVSEETYEEPEHEMLECPSCHHVDRKIHFKRVKT